ncbi:hypothetical protein LCGC14_2462810, partial [marine sediment metagenome]
YIISKGRWKSRLTSKALEEMKIPYYIVVEPQEYDNYAKVIDSKKILVLPFSNLGQASISVRNWVWEHSIKEGRERHWLLDDNIFSFWRLNRNSHIRVSSGTIFKVMEDFTDRYENVAFSGTHNLTFVRKIDKIPPFYLNTRIYSCTLIKNDILYRWRGIYNEDTDLCLRALKGGYCTILFNAFTMDKATTMVMEGGNTDSIYNTGDKRRAFAESLKKQHPDIVKVVWKFNRWHHQVNYKVFRGNKLVKKPNIKISKGINNYGMVLETIKDIKGE